MAYEDKVVDRCPIICAAGTTIYPNSSVKEALNEYKLADQVDAFKHDFNIYGEKRNEIPYKPQRIENNRHRGIHDKILQHITIPKKTRYQQLVNDLKETTYRSYWNASLGKPADPTHALPAGIDPLETTFGQKTKRGLSAYEIIFPKIPRCEVLWRSQVNHEKNKRQFNDYNVGEKIDRNYLQPPYNPNACAGYKTKTCLRGSGVAYAMNWSKREPLTIVSKTQADSSDKNRRKLGQIHSSMGNAKSGELTYKNPKSDLHGVAELLKPGCEPALFKKETLERMASLNLLRQRVKKKFSATFNLKEFHDKLAYYDQNGTNFIPLEKFYEVISCLRIPYEREPLEALFKDQRIIQSGKINYSKFIEAVNFDMELGKKLDPIPSHKLYYLSESSAANMDRSFSNNSLIPRAGLTSHRFDLLIPPRKNCESDRDNIPTDDVKTVLDRSLFFQYNISYRDMFLKRNKDFIETLFQNCGYKFAEGAFDNLFQMALEHDKTGGVCIDTFNKIVKKYQEPLRKIVDEIDFCPKHKVTLPPLRR